MSKLDKLDRETNELAADYKEEVAEEEELDEAEVTKKNLGN